LGIHLNLDARIERRRPRNAPQLGIRPIDGYRALACLTIMTEAQCELVRLCQRPHHGSGEPQPPGADVPACENDPTALNGDCPWLRLFVSCLVRCFVALSETEMER